MDRVLIGTRAAARLTTYLDGVATDPDTPASVAVYRANGEQVTTGTATDAGVGLSTFDLPAQATATLDRLRVKWTATLGGVAQEFTTYVEVVGGFLFTLAQARERSSLASEVEYPDEDLAAARTLAERALEDACGCAFVPRYAHETLDAPASCDAPVLLSWPFPRAVRSVAVNGTSWSPEAVSAVRLLPEGALWAPGGFTSSPPYQAVEVGYEHGHEFPPGDVGRAALALAEHFLVESPVDSRASAITNPDGTYQLLVTAGVRGAVFSVPEANAAVKAYGGFRQGVA